MSTRTELYLSQLATTLSQTPREPLAAIEQMLWETYLRDGTIFVCGNGGSATTATHFACDLAKWTINAGQRRLCAQALTDNTALMTAWANDTAYEWMFVEQLATHYRPGDVLVVISGSGRSPNIARVLEWARAHEMPSAALTGRDGGHMPKLATATLIAASQFMPEIEDVHSAICHSLAVSLGERIKDLA